MNSAIIVLIIFLVVMVVFAILFAKLEDNRFIVGLIFSVAYISLTVFSIIGLNTYYTAEGGIYGKLVNIVGQNEVEVVGKEFNFKNIMLTSSGNGEYSASFTSEPVSILEDGQKYGVFVNDMPCSYSVYSVDYIDANYSYLFKDEDREDILLDTLNIKVFFYKNYTNLIVSTTGGVNAVDCWNDYFNKNSFILSVKPDSNQYILGTGASNVYEIDLMTKNEKYDTVLVAEGFDYTLPTIEVEGYKFNGWLLNGKKVDKLTNINSNMTIEADLTKIHTVTLMTGSNKYDELKVLNGESVNLPEISIETEDCLYNGWLNDSGELINSISNVASDMTIYANSVDYYVVKFMNGTTEIKSQKVEENTSIIMPEDPTKVGYTFLGWKVSGESDFIEDSIVVTSNLTINAEFERGVHFKNDKDAFLETSFSYDTLGSQKISLTVNNDELCDYIKNGNFTSIVVNVGLTFFVTDSEDKEYTDFWFKNQTIACNFVITPNGVNSGSFIVETTLYADDSEDFSITFTYSFSGKEETEYRTIFTGTMSNVNITSTCENLMPGVVDNYNLIGYLISNNYCYSTTLYLD